MKVEPFQHLILIEIQDKPGDKVQGGVYFVVKNYRDKDYGVVLGVGEAAKNDIKVGEKVMFRPDSGTYIDLDGKKCIMTELGFIHCVIDD